MAEGEEGNLSPEEEIASSPTIMIRDYIVQQLYELEAFETVFQALVGCIEYVSKTTGAKRELVADEAFDVLHDLYREWERRSQS